ncbi:MAG TPA: GNAT family N-acetyltransferase [Sporosarcina sp.]|nr:GNAT family N-acetyltransferase [Sporosarcina sp.]
MEIRKLIPKDAEAYLKIRLQALQDCPEAFGSSFEEEKEDTAEKYRTRFSTHQPVITFGAFDEEEHLMGVVTLRREHLMKLKHRANVVAMYVKKEKWGAGVGKALLDVLLTEVRSVSGLEQIYLTVVTTNERAIRLYKSAGFEVFATENRALKVGADYFDEHHMVLFLLS